MQLLPQQKLIRNFPRCELTEITAKETKKNLTPSKKKRRKYINWIMDDCSSITNLARLLVKK